MADFGVSEVVDQQPRVWIDLLPEAEELHRPVTGKADAEHRIMPLVEQPTHSWQLRHVAKTGDQVLAIRLGRVHPEILLMPVAREGKPLLVRPR